MKAFPRFTLTIVFLLSLVSVSSVHIGIVQSATEINSTIITSDTTWTKANSPYTINGPIRIERGATVTVEPGTSVNLNNNRIEVWGTLQVIGTSGDSIILSNGLIRFQADAPGPNSAKSTTSIIQKATLHSMSLEVNYSSPKIADSEFTGSINANDASSLILENNIITLTSTSYLYSCMASIANNIIKGEPIWTSTDASTISNNTFIKMSINADGNTIEKNVFYGFGSGVIAVSNNKIEQNLFVNNNLAINVKGISNEIRYNTIMNCTFGGVVFNHGAVFAYNNIYGNSQYNVRIGGDAAGDYELSLQNNWWGTTDKQAISQTIYDNKNDYSLPKVNFTPFLTEPNSQAPTVPDDISNLIASPTPSQTTAPTATSNPNTSTSPTQNPISTPDQSGPQTVAFLGLDWLQVATVTLLGIIAVLLVFVVVFLRKRSINNKPV